MGVASDSSQVHLKSMSTGKLMEVDGADVKARSSLQGTRQRIFVRDAWGMDLGQWMG